MNFIAKLSNLSTKEKIALVAVVGVAGYVVYDQFAPKNAMAATNPPPSLPNPSVSPPPVPVSSTNVAVLYRVATQNDPLYVRSGPGQNYTILGSNPKGSIIKATADVKQGSADGAMTEWVGVLKPDGSAWGWSAKKYLEPVSNT